MALTGRNISFPIKNADGTAFHDLVLNKATYNSIVMSLGDKITGDVYYKDNTLAVTMQEYIEYDGVHYMLVNPPTVVREGMVSDNSGLNGMTKYSFEFYHPMCALSNFPFTDVAVSSDENRYKSQDKTFAWTGTGNDFIAKLNKNLQDTQWIVRASTNAQAVANLAKLPNEIPTNNSGDQTNSIVLSFDNDSIADALKTAYETWKVPFVISSITSGEDYNNGKRFLITFGLPSNEILDGNNNPFVFRFGQGVGLKNNSRNPRNNKIITRIAGYGSENNIPYGYPQIVWTGNQEWDYTINNSSTEPNSYPIYNGIVGGQLVRLIKHPFTRTHLMPSVYSDTVNKKVNPYAIGYDPDIEIVDYYDAPSGYPNPIVPSSPCYDIHEFGYIKPELGSESIISAVPYDDETKGAEVVFDSVAGFLAVLANSINDARNENEKAAMQRLYNAISGGLRTYSDSNKGGAYTFDCTVTNNGNVMYVKYTSDSFNIDTSVFYDSSSAQWIDDMDEEGNYVQSYFKVTLPQLSFDLYASAAITQEMKISMRSGACIGCTFPVEVDWEDYKKDFYDDNGNFDPAIGQGHPRNGDKYPDSSQGQITILVKKEIETFGTLMPNIYQQPYSGDTFVIIGISLPTSYISNAESRLDDAMMAYMHENNVYYYDYPLKFDEHFLATHTNILAQMQNNTIVRFLYAGVTNVLYIKQMTVKYGESPLPKYDITLTDDVEIVLNQIGQVTDDVSRMRVQVNELQKYYSENVIQEINSKLSKLVDDVCLGRITFQQGLNSIGSVILGDEIKSNNFQTGLYDGRGWRIDALGNAEFESARVRSYLEIVELIVNRLQAQEGDTLFTDNDQIDYVETQVIDNVTFYTLSLKEKYEGYVTCQMYGNVIKGIINSLAAKQAGVSDEVSRSVEVDGSNKYYTSWMQCVATHNTDNRLGVNQIKVVLYGDDQVPAQRNFPPCELMTIARWGCIDYSDPEDPDYEQIKASIERRQRAFLISTSEGRIVKYTGVDSPILKNGNYGVTIGELPDFVKNYSEVHKILFGYTDSNGVWHSGVGEHTDWLYAQGAVVGNLIKVDREGLPIPQIVSCEEWIDGTAAHSPIVIQVWDDTTHQYVPHTLTFPIPVSEYANKNSYYIGHGIYFYNEFNWMTQQYETHEVRHDSGRWQCLQHQPIKQGGAYVSYEPKWNSPYWRLMDGNENLSIEFVSSRGFSFRRGSVDTVVTPYLFYGNVDITDDVAAEYWSFTRHEEQNETVDPQTGEIVIVYTVEDLSWNAQHNAQKTLHLTNNDMPAEWSSSNKAIFTCTVVINDGKTTRIVSNQIIS